MRIEKSIASQILIAMKMNSIPQKQFEKFLCVRHNLMSFNSIAWYWLVATPSLSTSRHPSHSVPLFVSVCGMCAFHIPYAMFVVCVYGHPETTWKPKFYNEWACNEFSIYLLHNAITIRCSTNQRWNTCLYARYPLYKQICVLRQWEKSPFHFWLYQTTTLHRLLLISSSFHFVSREISISFCSLSHLSFMRETWEAKKERRSTRARNCMWLIKIPLQISKIVFYIWIDWIVRRTKTGE